MTHHTFWQNKRVLITGHTGFKGGWLTLWLANEGAKVHGIALPPETTPNFFTLANIDSLLVSNTYIDICDQQKLSATIQAIQPEIIFHLAAQSLVRNAYDFPLNTYAVNVMGTANVLECIRQCETLRAALIITTDKCYENKEWIHPYRENDRLGGEDPYSSSKACAELLCSAYRCSFLKAKHIHLATARAGNVIGGGDFAEARLVPDCMRALINQKPLHLRYPHAVRPWQHVLESIYGYLLLAEHLYPHDGAAFASSWNFGPHVEDMCTVGEVTQMFCKLLNISFNLSIEKDERHEASLLMLDSSKARSHLKWFPKWRLQKAIQETVSWYRLYLKGEDMLNYSIDQINRYKEMI